MKRIKLFAVLLPVLLFCACLPTPEEDFVVQKDSESLLEKATADAAPITLPQQYTAHLESALGRLSVEVNAQIEAPNTTLPIVRIRPCGFDREQIARIAGVLFGTNAHYVESPAPLTRAHLLRQAAQLQEDMEDWDVVQRKYLQFNTPDDAESALQQLMQDAAAAPETLKETEPSFDALPLKGSRESASDVYFEVMSMPDDATYSDLTAWIMPEDHYVRLSYMWDTLIPVDVSTERSETPEHAALTEAAARALCDDAAARMGLDGYTFFCAYPKTICFDTVPVYELCYTYAIDGAQMTFANQDAIGETYAAPWEQSEVRFTVDDSGILFFSLKNPFTVEQTEIESCALLSFEQICEIFERNVVLVQNQVDYNKIFPDLRETLHVTTVRLGLVSVREQNAATGLLVPAWDFLGYRSTTNNGIESVYDTNELDSFLTINAVDGSIISRANGY